MGTRVAPLVLLAGCKQLLGFESADPPPGGEDAAVDTTTAIDMPGDMPIDDPAGSVMVTFQHGDGGYLGGLDTYLKDGDSTRNDSDSQIRWRINDTFGLIRFDDIIGADTNKIPPGVTVASAKLVLEVEQASGDGDLHESAVDWSDSVLFDDFGGDIGVDASELGDIVTGLPQTAGSIELDVTTSLQKWVAGTMPNRGWVLVATQGAQEGRCRSNNDGNLAQHPKLVVTYTP